jgi:hypothetical protein
MSVDKVRQLAGHVDPCAVADCRERGQGGPAEACAGWEELDVVAAGCVTVLVLAHWHMPGSPLVAEEDNHLAVVLAVQAAPEAYNLKQSQTWCLLAPEAPEAVADPSLSDSSLMVAARQRCWRKRHLAGRKKRRPGHGRAVDRSRGLAEPDTVPCRVSGGRGGEHSTRTASGPPPVRCAHFAPVVSGVWLRGSCKSVGSGGGRYGGRRE